MAEKKYGCYDPKGMICMGYATVVIKEEAEKVPVEKIDEFYTNKFKRWFDEYDFSEDGEYKKAVEQGSSIDFCDVCAFKNNFKKCESYLKKKKRVMFY